MDDNEKKFREIKEQCRLNRMLFDINTLQSRIDEIHQFLAVHDNVAGMDLERLDLLMKQYHYMTLYKQVLTMRYNIESSDENLG